MQATDSAVEAALEAEGVEVHSLNSTLLQEPEGVRINMASWSGHFGTLTPFLRCHKRSTLPHPPDNALQPGVVCRHALRRRADVKIITWTAMPLQ